MSVHEPEPSPSPTGSPTGPLGRIAHSSFGGFIPWILFSAIGGPNTWETAAIAALIAAVLLTLADVGAIGGERQSGTTAGIRRPKLLDVATIIFFGGFVVAAFSTARHDVVGVDQYSQVISSGALAIIAFLSVLFGHPFTVDYAKDQTPAEFWHTPLFKHVNVVLTLMWGVIFGLCAGFGVAAVNATSKGAHDWFSWYLPIILIIVGFKLNSAYPDMARKQAQAQTQTNS
jgi:hypothetical protein